MNVAAERALFDACSEASPEERARLLAACPDDALRERVRRLLAVHDERPPTIGSGIGPMPALSMPREIGVYRILERLGEGAMGEVYLAEQREPVRRRVAIKVLKFGLATREVIARFELERQTLALLSHPNVARILDAGATSDGRPYFAMEYVAGIPLTRYCDERRLAVADRLALFAQICAGVQHAHLRGIIHRDLKPSNILVTEIDGGPSCHIIDFGIAKATTAAGGSDGDAHTRIGHLLGTPEYMSPEQARLSPLDIDARTDVYSLGVVLFELLTGSRPYAVTHDAIEPGRIAQELAASDAPRPSDAALRDGTEREERAARRGETPRSLAARLRGDLDWIVLKAIEKDRNRRYASPFELAADLERHARNEAVLAGPPSWTYRTGRFVRRHRFGVAAAATLFCAALLFGGVMAWLARETARERDRANAEAEVARRVTAFTAGLFELASPEQSGAGGITARELLDAGVRRLEAEMTDESPEIRAALLESAGNAYRGIGEYGEASRLIGQAVDLRRDLARADPAAYGGALMADAALRRDQGNYQGAVALAREAIAVLEGAVAGDAAPEIVLVRARLELVELLRRASVLDEAVALARQAVAALERNPGTPEHRLAVFRLGRVLTARGQLEEADGHLRRALQMELAAGNELAEVTLDMRGGLAENLVQMNRPAEALPLLRQYVETAGRVFGESHAHYGIAWNNLANALSDLPEHYAEAERAYLKALDIFAGAHGLAHPEIATVYNNLGALYVRTKDWQRAAAAHRSGLDLRRSLLGDSHPHTAASRLGLALALNRLDRSEEAETLLREAHAAMAQNLGAEHWRTANVRYYLGVILQAQGRTAEARREIEPAHATLLDQLGAEHPRTQAAAKTLAELPGDGRVH